MRPSVLAAIVRHEPYRLFFPLGAALGAVGVGWWLVWFADQTLSQPPTLLYRGHEHALVQAQGFLLAFVAGFLLTALPRRTSTAKPGAGAIALAALSLVVTTAALLARQPVVAQASSLVLVGFLLAFSLRRVAGGGGARRPPDAFVLLPLAFAQAALGSLLILLASWGIVGSRGVAIASGFLTEGTLLVLVMGVGRFVLPVLLGHPVPPDASSDAASRRARLGWSAAGLAVVASFPLQQLLAESVDPVVAIRVAYALRGGVALAALAATRAWRAPTRHGTQATLLLVSAWLVPSGLLLAAALPSLRLAMLHVTMIGGLGLMALAVGAHVTLAHGGHEELVEVPSRALRWFGGLVLVSVSVRVSADLWPDTYWVHLAGAAGTWLAGLAVWAAYLLPKALGPRGDGQPIVPAAAPRPAP